MPDARIKVIAENLTAAVFESVRADMEKMGAAGESANRRLKQGADDSKLSIGGLASGMSGLAAAVGVGFSISAVVGFGKAVLDDADALVQLHDKTGLSFEGLQRFQVAGDDAGNTVEQLSGAVNKLQDNVAGGNSSALAALKTLGVEVGHFKSLSPDEQFIEISDAIRKIHDPAMQVVLATDLMGKKGVEVLPTLKRGFDDVRDSAVGMSESTVRTLDWAGDQIGAIWRKVKAASADFLADNIKELQRQAINQMTDGQLTRVLASDMQSMTQAIAPVRTEFGRLKEILPPTKAELDALDTKVRENVEAHKQQAKALSDTREAAAKLRSELVQVQRSNFGYFTEGLEHVGLATTDIETLKHSLEEEAKAADKAREAHEKLNEKLAGVERQGLPYFMDGLDKISPQFKDAGAESRQAFVSGFQGIADDIPGILMRSFEGGGGLDGAIQSIGADIGSRLGTKIVSMIPGSMTSLFGSTVGGWMDTMLPGIGGMLGSFLGKGLDALMNIGGPSKAELQGRQIEAAFERGFGGFDAMMAKVGEVYNATGRSSQQAQADVARLMASEKQGGDAVQAVIDEINVAFTEQKAKVQDLAATEKEAQDARTAATQLATQQLDAMMQHRQSLADSIAGEAPEEVMGVIEAQTRSQMAVLDKQIEEQRLQMDASAEAMASSLESTLGGINPPPVHVPIVWDVPPTPGGGGEAPEPPSYANEAFDLRTPRLAVVGDAPGDAENVLRTSSIRALVSSAKRAGAAGGSEATVSAIRSLEDRFGRLSDKLEDMMRSMPIAMKHAMRGAY